MVVLALTMLLMMPASSILTWSPAPEGMPVLQLVATDQLAFARLVAVQSWPAIKSTLAVAEAAPLAETVNGYAPLATPVTDTMRSTKDEFVSVVGLMRAVDPAGAPDTARFTGSLPPAKVTMTGRT